MVLDGVEQFVVEQLQVLHKSQADLAEAGSPPNSGASLAAEFGVKTYQATADRVDWARAQLTQRT